MDENSRPEETPAANGLGGGLTPDQVPADLASANEATPQGETGEPGGDSESDPAARKAPRRRSRRRKSAPAQGGALEGAADEAAPNGADAPDLAPDEADADAVAGLSAERILLELAEREVTSAGEPMPLQRRSGRRGADSIPAPGLDMVLVPEASEETPPPAEGLAADLGLPLPPITPELLAEVRGVSPDEVRVGELPALEPEVRPRGGRGRDGAPPREPRVPLEPPAPVAAPRAEADLAGPALIIVADALLETVPEDWAGDEVSLPLEIELPPADAGRGRRKRRRGRDRDRRPGAEETPAVAAVIAPAAAPERAPAQVVQVPVRLTEEPRGEREPREAREHKEILINVDDRETRIAVIENGRLVELHVEREERVVGSVYKGRVSNVLPGMDAAFVDIGLERNAFLYVGDILFEDSSKSGDSPVRRTSRSVRISDIAKSGQEMLVQVVKGPRGTKGARVSTKMSIPGRYLVLMPEGDHLGVSRKVEDARERERLRKIGEQLRPKGFGLILRTEAEGRSEQELQADLEYLLRTWQSISEKAKKARAPVVIHKDLGVILKTIRDLFGADVDRLVIDSEEEYEKAVGTLRDLAPDLVDRVSLHDDPEPLFSRYNLEEEIERLLRRKVWLRNGAYLLVDTTEALTTFDVNTGKFVGTSSLSETILKTNLDAVEEIARQLRLRDLGGMIVLDFIDMASTRDRQLVMRALENAFKRDRTRIKIAHISPLGLVEMTRKRTADNVTDVMSHVCPYCQGRGRVWSPETMAIQIEREIRRRCATENLEAILVYANPEVAAWLIGPEGESIEFLERKVKRPVYVRARQDYHIEKYELLPADMMELEQQMLPFHGGQVVDCLVTKIDLITPPRSAAWVDGYFVDLANGIRHQGQTTRVRLTDVRRSFALGEPVAPSTSVDRSEPI